MQPLIVPPAGAAPIAPTGGFTSVWYLFLQMMRDWAAAGLAMVAYGTERQRLSLPTGDIPDASLWLETDTGLTYQWQGPVVGWVLLPGDQVKDLTLTAASTTVQVPASGVSRLTVILRQDATGGRAVVWGSGFSGASTSLGTASANTLATFQFVLSGGKYVMVGQPTVDMTP
jgi:hypothetical protein